MLYATHDWKLGSTATEKRRPAIRRPVSFTLARGMRSVSLTVQGELSP